MQVKSGLRLSVPGDEIQIFDGGSWQDNAENVNSLADEGDLTKIIENTNGRLSPNAAVKNKNAQAVRRTNSI